MATTDKDSLLQQLHDTIVSDTTSQHEGETPHAYALSDTSTEMSVSEMFSTDTHELITHSDSTSIELREGIHAEKLPLSTTDNPWLISILLLAFGFFAISYNRSAKYLRHLFLSLFKVNTRGNLFDETTINENQLKVSLLSITFITEGIAIYYALFEPILTNSKLILPTMALCSVVCWLYYLLQMSIFNILGNIFSNKQEAYYFTENFTTVNLFIGLFFTPLILAMLFVPHIKATALIIAAIFYILSRLIIIYKGIRFFSPHIFGLLYIILYLCALEIVPLLLIVKVVRNVYRLFELNLITP